MDLLIKGQFLFYSDDGGVGFIVVVAVGRPGIGQNVDAVAKIAGQQCCQHDRVNLLQLKKD